METREKAVSKSQFKLIQAMRTKYGTETDTPEKWKWVWKDEWTNVDFKELPNKVSRESLKRADNPEAIKQQFLNEIFGGSQ